MKNILWLASWYPSKVEPFTGDFIERHAKAVSQLHHVCVLHVVKDTTLVAPGKVFREHRKYGVNWEARITYYKTPAQRPKWLHRLISAWLYCKHFTAEARQYILRDGKPDLVHVHVTLRAGLIALYLKSVYKVPYVITEHWTGYCPEATPNFAKQGWLMKWLWKQVLKHASGFTVVSRYLGESIKKHAANLKYVVIPNVVDTTIFKPLRRQKENPFCFIHISTLSDQKNPEQMLEGIRILRGLTDKPFKLIIYGPVKPLLVSLCHSLKITAYVVFKPEVSQDILSYDLAAADALVLYSKYETFGCVVAEANACGVPVIASDIPVLRENVLDDLTGVFVPLNRPDLLAEKMCWMMNNKSRFDSKKINTITEGKFSFSIVAAQFDLFYNEVLANV